MGYRRLRWVIVALLFVSTVLNYVDRQTLSILSSTLRSEFKLTEADYANAVTAFLLSYTVMYSLAGRWLDRIGLRIGITACIAWWSLATMLTAFVRGPFSLAACRFLLGIGEPGIFPGGIKACAEWFPGKERALATGIFSSGSALGAIIAPPLIAWITLSFGWRAAFLLPGLVGLLWIPIWLRFYRPPATHPGLTPQERAAIAAENPASPPARWSELLRRRTVWALILPRFLADSVWFFYLFWLPDYLQRERHLSLAEVGFYGWIPFLFADIGNIGGGAASDWLVRRGWSPARARCALIAAVGCLSPAGALVGIVPQTAVAIAVTCLIACLTQVWSTNTATLSADLFPANERASVMGMMGTAGSLGGVIFSQMLAYSIASFGYGSAFMIAAILHPLAAIVLFLLLKERRRGFTPAHAGAPLKHAAVLAAVTIGVASASAQPVDFARDIKPILSNHCFQCHGPDSGTRQANLRLDTRDGVFARTGLVVPGDSAKSRLYQRIDHEKPALRMPPMQAKKPLTRGQIDALKRWIDAGAEWREHWAFRLPERPALPAVKSGWSSHPIDAFILQRLEQAGLQPEPEADRRTLLRRVSFDLTGLPPSSAALQAFLADTAPGAYERAVDRLLDSPHWGEHRARYWLDAARYADTHGLHADNYREMWPYRDWVINAFNRNLAFDRFTVEQLAGDLLPGATTDQRTATGFHRCNITTNEGGVIPAEAEAMYARDRVETTSTVWLGLTLGCAACHDHKFDPLTQKEFYQFAAFFMNGTQKPLDGNIPATPPTLVIPPAKDRARWDELSAQATSLRQRIQSKLKNALAASAKPELRLAPVVEYSSPENLNAGNPPGIASPSSPQFDLKRPFTIAARVKIPESQDSVVASYLGSSGPGARWVLALRSMFVQFTLHDPASGRTLFAKAIGLRLPPGGTQHIGVSYDGSGEEGGITIYAEGQPIDIGEAHDLYTGWKRAPFDTAALRFGGDGVTSLDGGAITDLKIFDSALSGLEMRVVASTKDATLRWSLAEADKEFERLSAELDDCERHLRAIRRRSVTTLVMEEDPRYAPEARILIRGQYDQPGDKVAGGIPAALGALPNSAKADRLALAQWITSSRNPLTARVTVNRFWQELFGAGIVKTAEDFGATGDPPSHPELLDWLAVEFRESGWDVKRLFRLMVTSAAYRQSAAASALKRERDPANRLLSRGPRFRMDGEMIRDAALQASGLLNPLTGGPSVKPYQPAGVWETVAVLFSDTRFYQPDSGANLYRRSLYTFWKRSAPPPAMDIFNAPTRESCIVRRERTNTPLQALAVMNDPQFVEAARRLAEIALQQKTFDGQLDAISLPVLSRTLRPEERNVMRSAHGNLLAHYNSNKSGAAALIRIGASEPDRKLAPEQLAAWTMIASSILNLDEALNK